MSDSKLELQDESKNNVYIFIFGVLSVNKIVRVIRFNVLFYNTSIKMIMPNFN